MFAFSPSIMEWNQVFVTPSGYFALTLCASKFSQSVIEDIENFISDYDKRINEVFLGTGEEPANKALSFSLILREFDMSEFEAEIQNIRDMLL